ncbi:hypothetical protein BKG60_06430 [Mycobacterium syngnathidarum]|uniref:MspA protein n=2 Tax=Mycobacteriaceae TaxID=1762 RepID=A0A1Q9WEN2_9MYCO|nr:hypothetical protein BKG61_12365 [Mycobacterium syngnathidarum]OLT97263.1 hypothetical protein BKG60_06430 [Mycobacterium syngnathidarum]
MLKTLVALAVAGSFAAMTALGTANQSVAQPLPEPPAPDGTAGIGAGTGSVPSAAPATLPTPEGWTLSVKAVDETQIAVEPLTTAISSREYLVGGTFLGEVTGAGKAALTGGTLEAGYQIGCGITADVVDARFGGNITPSLSSAGLPSVGGGLFAQIRPTLKPGTATVVAVTKVQYEGDSARATITGLRIKIDSCVGQSFIRSYATFTSSTADTQDVVSYVGVTKAV